MGACMHGWVCRVECLDRVIKRGDSELLGVYACMDTCSWPEKVRTLSHLVVSRFCMCPCETGVMCVGVSRGYH